MADRRIDQGTVNRERPLRSEMLLPGDGRGAAVKRLGIGGAKGGKRKKDPARQAAPETDPVGKDKIAATGDAGAGLLRLLCSEGRQLRGQQRNEGPGSGDEKIRDFSIQDSGDPGQQAGKRRLCEE
jgi:hypothetical protein